MGLKRAHSGLRIFVKAECANHRQGGCVFGGPCLVLTNKRCRYSEEAVLGLPDYKFRLPGYDYEKIYEEYGDINLDFGYKKVSVRQCPDCGEVLKPRQRFCEKCVKRHRQASGRKYNQKRTA